MPNSKSKKDISTHIFHKYNKCRNEHDVINEYIKQDLKEITSSEYIFMTLLTKCDLHHNTLYKILNSFRNNSDYCFSEIVKNPFKFVMIPDNTIAYEKALAINDMFNLKIEDKERYEAWLYDYILFQNNQIFVNKKTLTKHFYRTFPEADLNDLNNLLIDYPDTNISDHCTIKKIYDIEVAMTQYMNMLYKKKDGVLVKEVNEKSIFEKITEYETSNKIKFTKKQNKAIHNAILRPFSIICGLPGTGKSTITDCICSFYKNEKICLTAPTGIAANNIKQKCASILPDNLIFGTMHKLLFDIFIDLKSGPDIIIIDEFSMVDTILFYRILQWCKKFKCKLVLLADHKQLPPISTGYPLLNLIDDKQFAYVSLNNIKRQDNGKLKDVILKLSNDTLNPITSEDIDKKSVYFINYSQNNIKRLIETHDLTPSNCQFISPQHKHEEGTVNINKYLQTIYNSKNRKIYPPYQMSITSNIFQHDDIVVRNVNDYNDTEMYSNGDIGILKKTQNNCLEVHYLHNNRIQQILPIDLYEEFSLAYCMTVHKVQGSQFKYIVLIINDNHHFSWMNHNAKNLLYTAMSRATDKCFIIGNPKLLAAAQRTTFKKKHSVFMKHFD